MRAPATWAPLGATHGAVFDDRLKQSRESGGFDVLGLRLVAPECRANALRQLQVALQERNHLTGEGHRRVRVEHAQMRKRGKSLSSLLESVGHYSVDGLG